MSVNKSWLAGLMDESSKGTWARSGKSFTGYKRQPGTRLQVRKFIKSKFNPEKKMKYQGGIPP